MRKALKIQILPKKLIILTLLDTNTLIIISSIPKYYINIQTSRAQTGTTFRRVIRHYNLCSKLLNTDMHCLLCTYENRIHVQLYYTG